MTPLKTSEECKRFLAKVYLPPWTEFKRGSRIERGDELFRKFHTKNHQYLLATTQSGQFVSVSQFDLDSKETNRREMAMFDKEIRERLEGMTHGGNYGTVHYNYVTGELCIVLGDGDCCEPLSTKKDIRRMLKGLAGVESLEISAETEPEDVGGWTRLPGEFGTVSYTNDCVKCSKSFLVTAYDDHSIMCPTCTNK